MNLSAATAIAPTLDSRVAATEQRFAFRQHLRDANAEFSSASRQLSLVPRNEPSDLDGPLGAAITHILDGAALLRTALDSGATGLDGDRTAALSAGLDAQAAATLLRQWDDSGWGDGDATSAGVVLYASDRLVGSARRTLDSVLGQP